MNLIMVPSMKQAQIVQKNYSEFVQETKDGNVSNVEVQSNQILYQLKNDSTVYKTGLMDDPQLTERLNTAGVTYTADIVEQQSSWLTLIVSWLLPILLATWLLRAFMRNMQGGSGAGGGIGGGMGGMVQSRQSNAREYVKGRPESNFQMLPAKMRQRRICRKLSVTCMIQCSTSPSVQQCRKAYC